MTDFTVQPLSLQNGSYTAKQDRQNYDAIQQGEGVAGADDYRVTATGSNMILTSGATTKTSCAFIRGDTNSDQGIYQVSTYNSISVTIETADVSNPRVDQVVLRIYDRTEAGGPYDKATIEVVQGTPASGADLNSNRSSSAAALPSSALLLADVLVGAGVTSISQANVRDRRAFVDGGAIPMIVTNTTVPVVAFEDPPGVLSEYAQGSTSAAGASVTDANRQVAVLQYLPTRIVNATRIRFKYVQGTTAIATGAFNAVIYDASGRRIVETGSISYTGGAGSIQNVSATITATTFEAGLYYVFFGTTGSTASSFVNFLGSSARSAFAPNVFYHATISGVTSPITILSMYDSSTIDPVAIRLPYVPNIALSVG